MKRTITTLFRRWAVLSGLLWLVGLLPAAEASAARKACAVSEGFALVARAMQTKVTGTYQGRQTIIWSLPAAQGGGMMEIVTSAAHRGLRSRLVYLFPPDAAGRVMVDDGARRALYEPRRGSVLVRPSVSSDVNADRQAMLGLLRRNYTCTVVRRERFCGRMCAVVAIRPRLTGGAYRLCWVDQAQPFVVRLEEYDRSGCRRYVSAYDSLSFAPVLPAGALDLPPAARSAPRRTVRETLALPPCPASETFRRQAGVECLPAWLPRGYTLLRLSLLTPASAGPSLIQMRCSDGLQTLTISESRVGGPAPTTAELNGTLARYGQQAWVMERQGALIVVRGDLSLPPDVGAELVRSLAVGTEQKLARALKDQFGSALGTRVGAMRRNGWDYVGLVSAALFLRQHPKQKAAVCALLGKPLLWPAVARKLHADTDALEAQARAWIARAL